jgi:hypothetical protein
MQITFRLASEDYYDAALTHRAKNRRINEAAVLAMVVVLSVVWMRAPNAQSTRSYVGLGLLLVVLVAMVLASRWLEKFSFRNASRDAEVNPCKECSVDISEDGIQTTDQAQRDDWSHFSKYSESARSFILYQGSSVCAILPKRAFRPDSIDRFRHILKKTLPKY